MEQDPARDNLVHAAGYATAEPETLGGVRREGRGSIPMVLIAGAGFGADVFDAFMKANAERYSMLAVTLPGFGGTQAPPMPAPGTSYGERTWTRAAAAAVARLIEEEGIDRPVVVGHWLTGAQVALDVAIDRPDLVRAAVAISGVPKFVPTSGSGVPEPTSPSARASMVDAFLAPQWFKTVTPETWHDNNFLPRDYAIHPLRAQQLWRTAAEPPLPVWIRYLCEAWADDGTRRLGRLEVPVLVLIPRFDSLYEEGPQTGDYMQAFLHRGWEGVGQRSDRITIETIADSRVFMMDDRPRELYDALARFLAGPGSQPRRPAPLAAAEEASLESRRYWGGSFEQNGRRLVLEDAGLHVELPDTGWNVDVARDEPPILVRLDSIDGAAHITLQVAPVMGMSLEALTPLVESRLSSASTAYRRLALEPAMLAGQPAVRLDVSTERDGTPTRSVLMFSKVDADHSLTVSLRATAARFEAASDVFERFVRSVATVDQWPVTGH
jgi:pimeloyl-ACP methyl ester carboxylesterase